MKKLLFITAALTLLSIPTFAAGPCPGCNFNGASMSGDGGMAAFYHGAGGCEIYQCNCGKLTLFASIPDTHNKQHCEGEAGQIISKNTMEKRKKKPNRR